MKLCKFQFFGQNWIFLCWNFDFFAEIFDFDRNFCHLSQLKQCSFFAICFNFQGYPRPVEISGRQNWANMSNLAQFAQNERKKTTNVEK